MKQKKISMYGKAVDKNGEQHIVTIVGELTQETDKMAEIVETPIVFENNKEVQGLTIYEKSKKVRRLKYAFSICHPHDIGNFNQDVGIKLASKRLEKQPLGMLETTMRTTLCDDQVRLILFGELNYIINNIDKFINLL